MKVQPDGSVVEDADCDGLSVGERDGTIDGVNDGSVDGRSDDCIIV